MIKRIAIVVPAFNEAKAIASVVSNINDLNIGSAFQTDVIVVNDCSTDRTSEIAATLNCILLNLPVNLGIGGAVQTGFKYAYANEYDYAMQVDGDGQHPASEIPKLVTGIVDKDLDVLIGSRFIQKTGYISTFSRRMGIVYFKHLLKIFCGITITDSTSGFRIINRKTLAVVQDYYPDEYPEPESIILYSRNRLKIGEIPVTMLERQGGESSIRAFTSLYYMLKVSFAIFFTFIRIRNKKYKK